VSDPDPCAFGGVDSAAIPSIAAFQAADSAFASGSPFQVPPECPPVFLCLPGFGGSAFAGDDDVADAEVVQGVVDTGFAVAAVRGHGAGFPAGPLDDAFHRRCQPRCVGGVAGLHIVVEDDTVVVVNNLGFVAELDRLAEPALRDRPGVGVVQADPPGRPVRGDPGRPLPSLGRDRSGRLQQLFKIVDGTDQATPTPPRNRVRPAVELALRRSGSGFPQRTFRGGVTWSV
jgi:hypothetical protein